VPRRYRGSSISTIAGAVLTRSSLSCHCAGLPSIHAALGAPLPGHGNTKPPGGDAPAAMVSRKRPSFRFAA
jgi:hypothetical protein